MFGWTTSSMDMGGGNTYTMFMNGEKPVAGMVQPPPDKGDVPTAWVNYVTVEDLDAAVEKAQGLGAHPLHGTNGNPRQRPLRRIRRSTRRNDRVLGIHEADPYS